MDTARDDISSYFKKWFDMLLYLFYFRNRKRVTIFGATIEEIGKVPESDGGSKLNEGLKKIAGAAKAAGEKFQEDESLKSYEKAKQAQKATTDLMSWIISDFLLPMLTNLCEDEDESCSSVTVEADDEGETGDSQKS